MVSCVEVRKKPGSELLSQPSFFILNTTISVPFSWEQPSTTLRTSSRRDCLITRTITHISKRCCSRFLLLSPPSLPSPLCSHFHPLSSHPISSFSPPCPYLLICSSHEGHPAPRLKDTWWCWMQHMLLCSTTCENVAWKQCSYKYSMQPAPSALSGAACSTYKCKVPD